MTLQSKGAAVASRRNREELEEQGVEVFINTSHAQPQSLSKDDGRDVLDRIIHQDKCDAEGDVQRAQEEVKARRVKERCEAENALGEFLGYTMGSLEAGDRGADFSRGAARIKDDQWAFHIARLVFRLTRKTWGAKKDGVYQGWRIEVCSEFERIYGRREDGKAERQKAVWRAVERPADLYRLRREGYLQQS